MAALAPLPAAGVESEVRPLGRRGRGSGPSSTETFYQRSPGNRVVTDLVVRQVVVYVVVRHLRLLGDAGLLRLWADVLLREAVEHFP